MLSGSAPIAFIATAQPEAARAFYQDTLGLKLVADEPYALVFDLHGTMLRVQKVPKLTPQQHTVLGWTVTALGEAMAQLAARGVRFERFEGLPQDAQGVWTTPGGAKIAWFKDPDGNTLSLTQW